MHAFHKGTGLDGSWRALQAQIRLASGSAQGYTTAEIDGTLERMQHELFNQELKLATKSAAARRNQGPTPTTSVPKDSSKKTKRGPPTAPKPEA